MSRDFEQRGGRPEERPGGVVHYAGIALARLGAEVRVVTRLRPQDDDLLGPLRAEGVAVHALPSRSTTTYRNDYTGPIDRHELLETSDRIGIDDLPAGWCEADLVHLGPLHPDDLEPGVAARVGGIVGIDLQGLVRVPGGGRLAPCPGISRFLVGVDVVQASDSELPAVLDGQPILEFVRRYGVPEMVVTRGSRGVLLVVAGEPTEIAVPPAEGPHRVGAGDVFLASYLLLRATGRPPLDAATGATRVCATYLDRAEIPKGFRP